MTDTDDIRVKVAMAMGWTKIEPYSFQATYQNYRAIGGIPPQCGYALELEQYDEDANAAFTLCDRLKSEGWRWRASTEDTHSETCFQFVNDEFAFEATADTLPMAICLAFLKVVDAAKGES